MPQTVNTLSELAFMYGTDKADHGYMEFYERHLPQSPKKILELGVKDGKSIRMWLKYFPDAVIHGVDLFKEDPVPFQDERVVWHQGNQIDWFLLEKLRNEQFDIVIEDASHDCRKHWVTFWGLANSCKQYYVEDLHTCREDFFLEGLTHNQTILYAIENNLLPFNSILSENKNIALITCL